MAEIGRCGDCRYYRPSGIRLHGECDLIEVEDPWEAEKEPSPAYIDNTDDAWGYFRVLETFGCVQFEAKGATDG